jgi:uncharacterized protein YcbK (DUF882 family)
MSAPWAAYEGFDTESPFASSGTESPSYQGFGEAGDLPLAHESPDQATVRQAIAGGNTDVNKLTNLVFFARHPERGGRGLSASEPGFATLSAEWTTLRDTVVRPLLAPAAAPAVAGDIWVPGAERLANAKAAGGTYLDSPWRFVFHTIEGEPSADGFRKLAAGHTNPPHLWAMPSADLLLQTIPLNRSAYALARPGSIQTNRLHAVQVEVHGFAAKMVDATQETLDWLADRLLGPVSRLVPIDLTRILPTGPGEPCYGKNSSCRMKAADWQVFNGVCGHKHVPDNDHWDPGQLDLGKIAARARANAGPASYLRREQQYTAHDGPGFASERDDEAPWLSEYPPNAGEEGFAEQDEMEAFLESQEAGAFPSGVTLREVSGPTGPGQEHFDPNHAGEPLYDTGPDQQSLALSANFVVRELCSSGSKVFDLARISVKLVRELQKIRDRVGAPVQVTSGYRSYQYNIDLYRARGEKPTNSQHSSGRSADIKTAGMTGIDLAKLAIDVCGPDIAVGVASTYAHVDVRGEWARWTYFSDPAESARVIAELDAHRRRVIQARRDRPAR